MSSSLESSARPAPPLGSDARPESPADCPSGPATPSPAPADDLSSFDAATCPHCDARISRYVSKCPCCSRAVHGHTHQQRLARREIRQKLLLVLGAIAMLGLAWLLYAMLDGGMNRHG